MAKKSRVSKLNAKPKNKASSAKPASPKESSQPERKRDREATTQALLTAARCVFAKQGFDAATTREISQQAQTNEALIQRYFGGKAGLLEAILQLGRPICPATAKALPENQLKDALQSFFHRSCGESEQNTEFMKVVVSRSIIDPRIGEITREKIHKADQEAILKALRALQEKGKIKPGLKLEPVAFALSSLAFSLGFFGRIVHRAPESDVHAAIDAITTLLAQSLAPSKPQT